MQNSKIVKALANAINENVNSKYSFVIDNNQIDKVIGDAKGTLEVNNYIIKNVEIIFYRGSVDLTSVTTRLLSLKYPI